MDELKSMQAIRDVFHKLECEHKEYAADSEYMLALWDVANEIRLLPSVIPQTTGHCEDCKYFRKLPYHADTLGKCIHHTGVCPKGDWYCADYEPQESEDKE